MRELNCGTIEVSKIALNKTIIDGRMFTGGALLSP